MDQTGESNEGIIGFTTCASLKSLIKFCNYHGDVVFLAVYYLYKERRLTSR